METNFIPSNDGREANLDLRKILQKLLFHKYFFIFSLAVALLGAWLVNRYTTPVYTVKSSLLIKEDRSKTSAAHLLYGSEFLDNGRKTLGNDIIILKSTPFIRQVIENMHLDVSYLVKGNVRTSEVYNATPFVISRLDRDSLQRSYPSFSVIVRNASEYELFDYSEHDEQTLQGKTFRFGVPVHINGVTFRADLRQPAPVNYPSTPYIIRFNNTEQLAQYYRYAIGAVQPTKDASVINLSITTSVPAKDIDVLNKVMELYITHTLTDKTMEATRTIAFINQQLGEVGDSLDFVEDKLQDFKQRYKFTDAADPVQRNFDNLFDLETQKGQLALNDKYYSYLEEYLNDPAKSDKIVTPSSLGIADPLLNQLVTELVTIQIERNTFLKGGQSKSPLLADAEIRWQNIRKSILENLANVRANNRITLQDINRQIGKLEGQIKTIPGAERELVSIKRIYTLNENIYLLLLQKRVEAEIAKASATEDSRVVEPAYLEGLISPKTRYNYMLSLLAGVLIPLGLILLREYLVNSIRSREDIERISRIPIFGAINRKEKKEQDVFATLNKSKSMLAESFRSVRSNLGFFIDSRKSNTFLITSSISGEGKTFCSTSLAVVMAATDKKTILMTTDLRKPRVYLQGGIEKNNLGLSNYLIDAANLDQIIQHSHIPNLDFIGSGPIPPNPTELLMRPRMDELMKQLKERYDYVIVDTAPLGLVSDPMLLTQYADLNIYIVRQNYTPLERMIALNRMYVEGRIKNIGFLLNDVQKYSEGYYGYGYSGYGYYEEDNRESLGKRLRKLVRK